MTILYAAIISHFDLFFNPVFARFSAAVKSESAAKPRGRTGRSRRDLRSGMRAGHTRGGVPPRTGASMFAIVRSARCGVFSKETANMLVGRTGRQQRRPRAGTALRAGAFGFVRKNILFSGGCACNPRGRPAKSKPRRPSVPCASNEYPRAENRAWPDDGRASCPHIKRRCCGEQTTAYTRVVLRMRGRFFGLSFRKPPMRGGAPPFF